MKLLIAWVLVLAPAFFTFINKKEFFEKSWTWKTWISIFLFLLIEAATIGNLVIEIKESKLSKYYKDVGVLNPDKGLEPSLYWKYSNAESIRYPNGILDFRNVPIHLRSVYLHLVDFKAWKENKKLYVSTSLYDSARNLVAEIRANEWKLMTGKRFDKNFDENAFELRDVTGSVILQVVLSGDDVSVQGRWYLPDGKCVIVKRIIKDKVDNTAVVWLYPGTDIFKWENEPANPYETRKISPIFKYPSELHPGERIR